MYRYLKRILISVLGVIILITVATIAFVFVATSPTVKEAQFEKTIWKTRTNRAQMEYPRQGMAVYLINNKILSGKTKSEILDMLGNPDNEVEENEAVYVYFIGPCRAIACAENEYLEINFDSAGTVTKYQLVD